MAAVTATSRAAQTRVVPIACSPVEPAEPPLPVRSVGVCDAVERAGPFEPFVPDAPAWPSSVAFAVAEAVAVGADSLVESLWQAVRDSARAVPATASSVVW